MSVLKDNQLMLATKIVSTASYCIILMSTIFCTAQGTIIAHNISDPTRCTIQRDDNTSSPIIYYLSTPLKPQSPYPITILCEWLKQHIKPPRQDVHSTHYKDH